MPKVSIIAPCYNVARFLGPFVNSVRAQTSTDWELILVDDGSSDETGCVVDLWCKADPRIRSVHQSNRGASAARNAGWRLARLESEFLMFVDPDDVLEPEAVSALSEDLATHPEAGAVLCHRKLINLNGASIAGGHRDRWAKGRLLPRRLRDNEATVPFVTFFCGNAAGPFVMWRRQVLDVAGPWDETLAYWEDADIFCRVSLLAPIRFLPRELYGYRCHPGQATARKLRVREYYQIFRRKWLDWQPRDEREARVLADAHRFYYRVFRPLRELDVARKAFGDFLRGHDPHYIRWAWVCLQAGWRKLVEPTPPLKSIRQP